MRLIFLFLFLNFNNNLHSQEEAIPSETLFFSFPPNENNCIKHFNRTTNGVAPVNAFLLAKMSELMYPERLDYQLRYLLNNSKPVTSLPSTEYIKTHPLIDNSNFRLAFESRFSHYFGINTVDSSSSSASFYFLEKAKLDTVSFFGIKSINGYDPEIILIDYDDLVLILFRGTDDVTNVRFAEWKGTDFNLKKVYSDSILNHAKIHKGFWESFDLIKTDLLTLLEEIGAKNKSIWLSGHSLGGAMAILSGTYLQNSGYSVANIYTYASPRGIGDKNFAFLSDSLLPNRIHRFEYYLDPISIMKTPGYKDVGTRHWFDNATKSNYTFYQDCGERYFLKKPFEFSHRPFMSIEKQEISRINRECKNALITNLPSKFFYHNTQWYVYGTYGLIPNELKSELPNVDDSFPFIYYGWDKAK